MLWVLQTNFFSEPGYARLVAALERLNRPHVVVKPVPFTDRLLAVDVDTSSAKLDIDALPEPELDTNQNIIAFGSYTLAKIAVQRGWRPGAFIDNLAYDAWSAGWGAQRLLNPNAQIVRLGAAAFADDTAFVRPVEDSKSFAGKLFEREEFQQWRDQILQHTQLGDPLDADTMITISAPQVIHTETRLFIVDGEIATYSQYRRGGRVHASAELVDDEVLEFARECVAAWRPNDAFAFDIAQTPNGCKIIEVNCINASGFYACDMITLVMALERFSEAR